MFTMESGKVIVNGAVYKGLRASEGETLFHSYRACWQLHAHLQH